MTTNTVEPFDGDPKTCQHVDTNGDLSFTVIPCALTPLRAKIADLLGAGSAVALAGGSFFYLDALTTPPDWAWCVAVLGPWLVHPILKKIYRYLLKKKTRIVFTTKHFKVRTWKGWKIYNRQLPHKFALIQHDKTKFEHERYDLAERRRLAAGEITRKTRYYGESWHLYFGYLGQRNDVVTIYGNKEAVAILARLKACDEVMDAQAQQGNGIALVPSRQWGDQPGEIPNAG